MQIEYVLAELGVVEQFGVYTVCPGCLALRIVVPSKPLYACSRCWWWWNYTRDKLPQPPRTSIGRVVEKLEVVRAEVLLVDGFEPLIVDQVAELVENVRAKLPDVIIVARSFGLVDVDRRAGNVDALVMEYDIHVAETKPEKITYFDMLMKAAGRVHIEAFVPYNGREANPIITSMALKGVPVTVEPLEENVGDEAYSLVEKLRRDKLLVFLHGDSSYTLLDVFCPKCGMVLVERKPWGVRRRYKPYNRKSVIECPSCGARVPLVDRAPRTRRFMPPNPVATSL